MSQRQNKSAESQDALVFVGWKTWVCFAGLLIGQFIAVLDVQIVTSSLAMIQAGVSASREEISWLQTSYLIAETVAISLTGILSKRFGTRDLFSVTCGAFVAFSLLVGVAQNLTTLVVARTLQGFAGGIMLPMAFTYGFTDFPAFRKPRVSLILALASVSAPALGPVLGGYLADLAGWRWLFFVNILPGAIAIFAVTKSLDPRQGRMRPILRLDWWSLTSLSVCLAAAQFVLEEGLRRDWFADGLICALTVISLGALAVFVRNSFASISPLIDLRPLFNSEFRTGWLMITVSGVSIFGGSYLLPLFLSDVRRYSPLQIGQTLVISGTTMVIAGLLLVPRLNKLSPKLLISGGFALAGLAFWLGRSATAQWDFYEFANLQVWRGIGMVVAVTATQGLAMRSLAPELTSSATSLLYLSRNLGGAFGVAILSDKLNYHSRQAYADLAASMNVHPGLNTYANAGRALKEQLTHAGLVLGFNHCFALVGIYCWMAALLALTLPRPSIVRNARAEVTD